jgi:AraC-like DNA-binding protein
MGASIQETAGRAASDRATANARVAADDRVAAEDQVSSDDRAKAEGLWRTILAGPGRSLADAFANLEQSSQVRRVLRHRQRDLLSARVTLTPEEGEGYWELTRIRNDLYVILSSFAYKNPRFEIVPGDGLPQFNFKVSGDMTYAISVPGQLRFNRPALHIWRQAHGVDMREWTAPSAYERSVSISVRPEFLLEHILDSSSDIPAPLRAFVTPSQGPVDFCQLPLTAQMIDVTTRLLDNLYSGALALTFTESLAVELLCLAVGHFSSLPDHPTEEYSDRKLQALRTAREMLMTELSSAPPLKRIARSVGLAEKALTRGFKAVYGETLFDFSVRCRMQHALMLLRDRHWSVDRVSEAVGYSHPTTFATAFRRHFGTRPIDVKCAKQAIFSRESKPRRDGAT